MRRSTIAAGTLLTTSLLLFALQSRSLYLLFTSFRSYAGLQEGHLPYAASNQSLRVGMDLTASYGTVAVGYPNGSVVNIAKIEGSDKYRETMYRLSLRSSEHPHPPYDNMWDQMRDARRQRKRAARKAAGLPASSDVAIIAEVITGLRSETEKQLRTNISSVVGVTMYLNALYDEDVFDAFEYTGLDLLRFGKADYEYEASAAYAGYGLGLCTNYTSWDACWDTSHSERLVAVLYTKAAFAVSTTTMHTAFGPWEGPLWDIELGANQRHQNPNEDYYWEAVRDKLRKFLVMNSGWRPVEKVLLMGESASDQKFLQILEEAMASVLYPPPRIYLEDPVFVAARGALEFVTMRLDDSDGTVACTSTNDPLTLEIIVDSQADL